MKTGGLWQFPDEYEYDFLNLFLVGGYKGFQRYIINLNKIFYSGWL